MAWDLNISRKELLASAGAADTLVEDLGPPLDKAVTDLADAAAAFRDWSVGPSLRETGEGWGEALGALREKLASHAEGMRLLVAGNDIQEQEVAACFRGW
ncbi:hypothetical protein [Streptomyces albus]|uniref:hypothetical protein n=1 Tax=Streptomyces albus TaxID=1888 RepID=UPI0004C52C50|nr:hypothetical protein [Streptomyces albus]